MDRTDLARGPAGRWAAALGTFAGASARAGGPSAAGPASPCRAGRGPDGQARTREIKLAALFTQTTRDAEGQPIRDPQSTTYLVRFVSADPFGGLVRRVALARGLAQAQRVIFLGDGAAWVWESGASAVASLRCALLSAGGWDHLWRQPFVRAA